MNFIKVSVSHTNHETGHWIDEGWYADGHSEHSFRCSECGGHIIEFRPDDYCKFCGAKMEVLSLWK